MKTALAFTDHSRPPRGPITRSLFQAGKELGLPLLFASRKENWDDHELLIWFHNRPPNIQTTAKVGWWMCDARTTQRLRKARAGNGYADFIFLCNSYLLNDYSSYYGGEAFHVPQCGDDTPMIEGRTLDAECVFIGSVPELNPSKKKRSPQPQPFVPVKDEASDDEFEEQLDHVHSNRYPILHSLMNSGISVYVLQGERVSKDQKWIYSRTPFCLAISPQIPGYTSNRLYNILASGGFCLTLKFPGIEAMFENHKHLVWFESPEEAIELIRYYRGKPAKMQDIRDAGFAEYQREHSAVRRVEQMIGLVKTSIGEET